MTEAEYKDLSAEITANLEDWRLDLARAIKRATGLSTNIPDEAGGGIAGIPNKPNWELFQKIIEVSKSSAVRNLGVLLETCCDWLDELAKVDPKKDGEASIIVKAATDFYRSYHA